jgi:L-amino acid N-acyltransferase YncA
MLDESLGTIYTAKTGVRYLMRDARFDELDEIYSIWQAGMEQHGYMLDPGKRDAYAGYLEGLMRSRDDVYKFWVAESEHGEIAGWQALMPYSNNPFSRELAGESSTYVRPSTQVGGVAYILLYHVIAHARTTRLHHVIAFVAEDNRPVALLAEKLGGWQRIGVIPSSPRPPSRPGLVVFVNVLS